MDVRMLNLNIQGDHEVEDERSEAHALVPTAQPPRPWLPIVAPKPDLAGSRRVAPGCTSVFVVDPDGYRRSVPSHKTYNRIFRGWQGVVDDPHLERLAERTGLTTGATLVRGDLSPTLYLLDHGIKRCIPGPATMDKYWFNWERIEVLKQFLVDTIPNGRPWQ